MRKLDPTTWVYDDPPSRRFFGSEAPAVALKDIGTRAVDRDRAADIRPGRQPADKGVRPE